jgi:F420-dependent oxidoreductase-like protein
MPQADIGIMIEGQDGLNWERWQRIVRTVEDSGYQCLFRSDHFTNTGGPVKDALELWSSLTWLADHTERIEFGPLVTPITFRHPAITAQNAAAVNELSDGRLVLGLGTGWQDREHQEYDIYFPELAERYEMLEDGLEVITRLLNPSTDDSSSYEGTHYSLDDTRLALPTQPTTMLIGGNGPKKTMPLAARFAEEWNAVYLDRDTYQERYEHMHNLLDEAGRSADAFTFSLMTRVIYGQTQDDLDAKLADNDHSADDLRERGIIVGVGDEILEQVEAWADIGVERFMLQWLEQGDTDGIAAMADVLLPHFHTD